MHNNTSYTRENAAENSNLATSPLTYAPGRFNVCHSPRQMSRRQALGRESLAQQLFVPRLSYSDSLAFAVNLPDIHISVLVVYFEEYNPICESGRPTIPARI
jgi:hypothetical protein